MGQRTLPVMNRQGYSSVWNYIWDDKLNYSDNYNEDIFLKHFFERYFSNEGMQSQAIAKYIDSTPSTRKNKFSLGFSAVASSLNSKQLNKNINYKFIKMSKIYLLRYNGWCIIHLYVYKPNKINFKQKRSLRRNVHIYSSYSHVVNKESDL